MAIFIKRDFNFLLLGCLIVAQTSLVFETFGEQPSRELAHQIVFHLDTSNDHRHDPSFGSISESDHDHAPNTLTQDLGYGDVTTGFDSSECYQDVFSINDTLIGALTLPYKPPRWI